MNLRKRKSIEFKDDLLNEEDDEKKSKKNKNKKNEDDEEYDSDIDNQNDNEEEEAYTDYDENENESDNYDEDNEDDSEEIIYSGRKYIRKVTNRKRKRWGDYYITSESGKQVMANNRRREERMLRILQWFNIIVNRKNFYCMVIII
jgi:hypothetical protein